MQESRGYGYIFGLGEQKGMEEGARAAILEFLEGRFGERPAEAEAALKELRDVDRLQELRRQIFREDSLEGRLELLRKAANGAARASFS